MYCYWNVTNSQEKTALKCTKITSKTTGKLYHDLKNMCYAVYVFYNIAKYNLISVYVFYQGIIIISLFKYAVMWFCNEL